MIEILCFLIISTEIATGHREHGGKRGGGFVRLGVLRQKLFLQTWFDKSLCLVRKGPPWGQVAPYWLNPLRGGKKIMVGNKK